VFSGAKATRFEASAAAAGSESYFQIHSAQKQVNLGLVITNQLALVNSSFSLRLRLSR